MQPANADETARRSTTAVDASWQLGAATRDRPVSAQHRLPARLSRSTRGRGWRVHEGGDAVLFAYGPVMLHEALLAAETLAQRGIALAVVNQPWLNVIDVDWLAEMVCGVSADIRRSRITGSPAAWAIPARERWLKHGCSARGRFAIFGVEGAPACGTPAEALAAHGLDGASIARRVVARRPRGVLSVKHLLHALVWTRRHLAGQLPCPN